MVNSSTAATQSQIEFEYTLRVFYEDTDAGGVVYHSNYLNFMERARSEWLRSLGWDIMRCQQELEVIFVVKQASLDFVAPARLADELRVCVQVIKLGKVGLTLEQAIYNENRIICSGLVKLAAIDSHQFTLKKLPSPLLAAMGSR